MAGGQTEIRADVLLRAVADQSRGRRVFELTEPPATPPPNVFADDRVDEGRPPRLARGPERTPPAFVPLEADRVSLVGNGSQKPRTR